MSEIKKELIHLDNYTKEEVIALIHSNERNRNLFDNLTVEQKQDNDIVQAIVDCLKTEALIRSLEKEEQYRLGANGGMDVGEWELKKSEQLDHLRTTYFANTDENKKINDTLLSIYYNESDIIKDIESEITSLESELKDIYTLENNKELYIEEFTNNYLILQDSKHKYKHLFESMEKYINTYSSEYNEFEKHQFYDAITAEIKGLTQWNDIEETICLKDLVDKVTRFLTMKIDELQKDILMLQEKTSEIERKFWKTKQDKIELKKEFDLINLNKQQKNKLESDIESIKQESMQFMKECKAKNSKKLCDISMMEDVITRNEGRVASHSFEIEHQLYFFSERLSMEEQKKKVEEIIEGITSNKEKIMNRMSKIKEIYQKYGNEHTQELTAHIDRIYNA